MATTLTYTSNSTLSVTASFISASVQCWGAGGHGGLTGVGGSGGAYASSSIVFLTGSYPIYVGQATSTDGGNSYITSGSTNVVVIRAAGGKQDGMLTHLIFINNVLLQTKIADDEINHVRCIYIWCRQWDSNSRPDAYKATALPTELYRQKIIGAGGQNRTGLLQLGRLVGYHSLTRIKCSSLRAVTPIHKAGAKDHFALV